MNLMTLFNNNVKNHFNAPAITMAKDNETWSYSYLNNRVCQIAYYLKNKNINKGDGVLILVPMSLELYAFLLALFKIGAVAVFIDPQSSKSHIQSCIKKYPLKAFFGVKKAHLFRVINKDIRDIPLHITLGYLPFTDNLYNYYDSHKFLAENTIVQDEDPALITFTSGSTGNPKVAVRTHEFLLKQYEVLSKNMDFSFGKTDISTLPVFVLANLAAGMHSVIPQVNLLKPSLVEGDKLLKDIVKYRATRFGGSPVLVKKILPFISKNTETHLTHVYMGGGPVYPKDIKHVKECLSYAKVYGLYGSTESEPISHLISEDYDSIKHDLTRQGKGLCVGIPVKEIEVKIIDSSLLNSFSTLPEVECGEIIVSGEHVLKGYLNGEGDKENKINFGNKIWHRTGDTGYFDKEGNLWLLGRYSQIIKNKGDIIYPFAVEAALYEKGYSSAVIMKDDNVYLISEGKCPSGDLLKEFGIDFNMLVEKIPRDRRHNSKIDYNKLKDLI